MYYELKKRSTGVYMDRFELASLEAAPFIVIQREESKLSELYLT